MKKISFIIIFALNCSLFFYPNPILAAEKHNDVSSNKEITILGDAKIETTRNLSIKLVPRTSFNLSNGMVYELEEVSEFYNRYPEDQGRSYDTLVYSSSFRLKLRIEYSTWTSSDGIYSYFDIKNVSGGYEVLDSRCRMISQNIRVGQMGWSDTQAQVSQYKDYSQSTNRNWSLSIPNWDPVSNYNGVIRVGVDYNYRVAHGSNEHADVWKANVYA